VALSTTRSRRPRLRPAFAIATVAGRNRGSAFSTIIVIKRSAFEVEGETAIFDDVGSSGLHVARRYCPRCGSPLTTKADVTPDLMFVKAGGIDRNEWFRLMMELFVGKRRPWVAPVPGAQQFDSNPPI
jgi:hypothetical protein